ncbi:helix-turn-helix domain-containing protein [Nocardia sp. NPDC127579]|uniref:AraC family transcriptional regulator n=1 Tax=Nocardia sp. NPDC127579 TaxID=3345402 RepID=UPI0036295A46
MRSQVREPGDAAAWDVVCPPRRPRVPGVRMAGFRDRAPAAGGHRAIPHPAVTILLEFGSSAPVVETASGQHRGSLVAAPGPIALWVRGENVECVQLRLSPVLARTVLGVSPAELDGSVVTLTELWGREAARIREQLSAASWPERFALAETAVLRRRAGTGIDPEIAWAWHRLVTTRGRARIDTLAADLGWSRKRLWSRFTGQLGMPPKRAAALIRFDHAARDLAAGIAPALVAAQCGYTDQSHLHRDVAAFTGLTPGTLAVEPWLAVDDLAWS